tara:strand:+ start:470 stop:1105 length:636 start_codon:yes stop_codon:yes gene_type:complete
MYSPNLKREETIVIYQNSAINFRIYNSSQEDKTEYSSDLHTKGILNLVPNKIIHVRLFSTNADINIDGFTLDELNSKFLNGDTDFIILENSGKFTSGVVNYLQFECVEIESTTGVKRLEVKVKMNVLQEQALGHTAAVADWTPNTYYVVGNDIIGPDNRIYNCIESHTSTTQFDTDKFERQGSLDMADANLFEQILNDSGSDTSYTPQSMD